MSNPSLFRPKQPLPIGLQLVEVERELKTRERVFPRWVADGRLTAADAERRLDAMRNVHATLLLAEEKERLL